MHPTTRRVAAAAFALAAGTLAGCGGDPRQNIQGSVTLKGEPLTSGVVQFLAGDRLATANVQPDGTFVATDLLPGEYKVAVVEDPSVSSGGGSDMPPPPGAAPPPATKPRKSQRIPAQYKNPATSKLVYPVNRDTTRIDIKLE